MREKITVFVLLCFVLLFADAKETRALIKADEAGEINIFYNGKEIKTKSTPIMINGKPLFPLREVMEAIGEKTDDGHLLWNSYYKTATIVSDAYVEHTYELRKTKVASGSKRIYVNDNFIEAEYESVFHNGRMYVPYSLFTFCFNKKTAWNENDKKLEINDDWRNNSIKGIIKKTVEEMEKKKRFRFTQNIYYYNAEKEAGIDIVSDADFEKMFVQKTIFIKPLNLPKTRRMAFSTENYNYIKFTPKDAWVRFDAENGYNTGSFQFYHLNNDLFLNTLEPQYIDETGNQIVLRYRFDMDNYEKSGITIPNIIENTGGKLILIHFAFIEFYINTDTFLLEKEHYEFKVINQVKESSVTYHKGLRANSSIYYSDFDNEIEFDNPEKK